MDVPLDEEYRLQHLLCSEDTPEATVTHTDSDDKEEIDLVWVPPPNAVDGNDEYYFHYTIVKDYGNIWVGRDTPVFSF